MELRFKKLHAAAKAPEYAHDTDAGLDLFSVADVTLAPGERQQIPTGIALAIPAGYVGLVWDKSGVSHKRGLKVLGGVVDAGYRGELLIGLVNIGSEPQSFAVGDKLAQILIQAVEHPILVETDELDATQRGEAGFGSTGA